jgi:hypothetical protein
MVENLVAQISEEKYEAMEELQERIDLIAPHIQISELLHGEDE